MPLLVKDPTLSGPGSGRPRAYWLPDPTKKLGFRRVPGVTTITGRYKDSGGLIRWAHQKGVDGESMDEARDDAAAAGHAAHELVHASINELAEPDIELASAEIEERARGAFVSYQGWAAQTKLRVLMTETPMIHPVLAYGGTWDALGVIGDCFVIPDWKTGQRTYVDMIYQLGAYLMLIREGWILKNDGKPALDEDGQPYGVIPALLGRGVEPALVARLSDPGVEEIHLIRFGKEYGDFHHHKMIVATAPIQQAMEGFRLMRRLYEIEKTVSKII
jgi:hypothetical protein